jgi:hypothetical protein
LPLLFDRDREANTHKKPGECLRQVFSIRWEETKSGMPPLLDQRFKKGARNRKNLIEKDNPDINT